MDRVTNADVERPLQPSFRPSALARAIRIAPTKQRQQDIARMAKRIAVVLRPGMKQDEFRCIDLRLTRNKLITLAVLTGNKAARPPDTPLCGLIITGSDAVTHPAQRRRLEQLVNDARQRDLPVLALSDSAMLALGASGFETEDETDHRAVLIDDGVTWLHSRRDVDRAIDALARSPAR